MSKYLKLFETTSQYNAYTADTANFIKPNVSLITETNTVEYNPWVETRVVAKYNVTTDTKTQMILGYRQNGATTYAVTTAFTSVYVDGNEIEISDANINYTFDTVGEHIVKYELKDPTKIDMGAFNGSFNGSVNGIKAVSITIPDSVTTISNNAFVECISLTSINIPSGVTGIGNSAFQNCSSLTSITIPSGVTSISSSTFYYCTSLTSIDIPDSVTSINSAAFAGCSSLTSIEIPDSVTSIGDGAFAGCSSLTSCTIEATTPPNITTQGAQTFQGTTCTFYVPSESVETYKADSKWSTYADRIQPIA